MRYRSSLSVAARGAAAGFLTLAATASALGFVNPQYQPVQHVLPLYKTVLGGKITAIDYDNGLISFSVTRVCVGEFAPREVTVRVPDTEIETCALLDEAEEGATVVAFVGNRRPRHERDVLLYCAQQWHDVTVADLANVSAWQWAEALGDRMVGTFNGAADQLLTLMIDAVEKRDFFPAVPTAKFRQPLELGALGGPIRGVSLYDVDGDGRLDAYACSPQGNRLYLQVGPLQFEDRTAQLGLAGVAGASCSWADVNADGRADLLADGAIFLRSASGLTRSELLPTAANQNVKSAAFVELNGDGYPDVVISRAGGGLAAWINPGPAGGPMRDATAASGLDLPQCGAGKTGFFAPGDWNGDGRTDLYYAVDRGLILVQDAGGRFALAPSRVQFDYTAPGGQPGQTGAGCFATLWRPGSTDLVSAGDMHVMVVTNENGTPRNVTGVGNEIRVCSVSQLATLAEDLNMDGYVDLLTITRQPGAAAMFHANRGYGSYLWSVNYMNYDGLPGKSFSTGAGGVAAGDVDGDGANDVLFGGVDGTLRLSVSDALGHPLRQPKEHPTALEQKLGQIKILSVAVEGRLGVVGAEVRLADAAGRPAGHRQIGSQVLTGCRGPDTVNLALREPGTYTLTVRFSDGKVVSRSIDLGPAAPRHVSVSLSHGQAPEAAK